MDTILVIVNFGLMIAILIHARVVDKQNELLIQQNNELSQSYSQNIAEINAVIEQNKLLRTDFKIVRNEMEKYYEAVEANK